MNITPSFTKLVYAVGINVKDQIDECLRRNKLRLFTCIINGDLRQ